MARTVVWSVPSSPQLFTPAQLQPREAFSLGFQSSFAWLTERLGLGHRRLLEEHRLGFVVYGAHLTYREPLKYLDLDTLEVETSARVKAEGRQVQVDCAFRGGGRHAAQLQLVVIPLWIGEGLSHSAVPAVVEEPVLSRFLPDEIDELPYRCPIPALVAGLEKSGQPLAETRRPVTLHRHYCEFADQWYFAEVAGFAGAGREALAFTQGAQVAALRRGLSEPMRAMDMLFTKPGFFADALRVESKAYAAEEGLTFVHRVCSDRDKPETYAVAVERF